MPAGDNAGDEDAESLSEEHRPKARARECDSHPLIGWVTQGKSLKFSGPWLPFCKVRLQWDDEVGPRHTPPLDAEICPNAGVLVQPK